MIGQIGGMLLFMVGAAICVDPEKRVATSYTNYQRQYEPSKVPNHSPTLNTNQKSNNHYAAKSSDYNDGGPQQSFSGDKIHQNYYPKVPLGSPVQYERSVLPFQGSALPLHGHKQLPVGLVPTAAIPYSVDRTIPYPFKLLQPYPLHQPVLIAAKLPYLYQPSYPHQDGAPQHYPDYLQHFR